MTSRRFYIQDIPLQQNPLAGNHRIPSTIISPPLIFLVQFDEYVGLYKG